MRRTVSVAALAAFLLSLTVASAFARPDEKPASATARPAVTNQYCPVMGTDSEVDPKVRTEYEGQYVYFCCAGCMEKFKKDPKAYIAKMSPADQEAIKVNKVCPTSGEEITDFSIKSEAEGKLVYFCCAHCKTAFDKKSAHH